MKQEMLQVQLSYEIDRSCPQDEGILFPQRDSSLEKNETLFFSPSSSSSTVRSLGNGPSPRDTPLFSGQGRHFGSQGAEAEAAGGAPAPSLWPHVEVENLPSSQEIDANTGGQSPGDAWKVSWPKDAFRNVQPDEQSLQALESLTEICGEILPSTGNVGVNDGQEVLPKHQDPVWESFDVPRLPGWPSPGSQPPVEEGSKDACNDGIGVELEAFIGGSSVVGLSGRVAEEERELAAALEASRQAEAMREQEERDAKAAIDVSGLL